eukprot:CAMPEP_0174249954 /NCGR_PEP_ID=MMETSP0439-20130205/272_1 /TAXON_ID=0 /ORGANISM="Stereomyxa ramosa, Strain Chinc5" /LENGTH=177 /DNA_ID=CAMNT_0015329901 /DNA_START=43 /DNA_END=576 /DNA_ORIENTATION=-
MPAYHSGFNRFQNPRLCSGMPLLPIKTRFKGPALGGAPPDQPDVIDEAVMFYKANVLFRNYEIKGPADRILVYLTLYINMALKKIANLNKGAAENALYQLAIQSFAIPGDRNFVLAGFVTNPTNRQEADLTRQYLTQLRQECGLRLVQQAYRHGDNAPSKWWTCFNRKKFLNKELHA